MLPEAKTVHYQRRHSAFAQHRPSAFDWDAVLCESVDEQQQLGQTQHGEDHAQPCQTWVHVTGITPLISASARVSWMNLIEAAHAHQLPVSIDFNHRKQLGTLEELWALIRPQLPRAALLIIAPASLLELVQLEGRPDDGAVAVDVLRSDAALAATETNEAAWGALMQHLRNRWCLARLACTFKVRDATGRQQRWSIVCDRSGVHSSRNRPVFHRPLDECGGGSAWAAGFIDALLSEQHGADSDADSIDRAVARADLLAALAQQTRGDFSRVTWTELMDAEQRWCMGAAHLPDPPGTADASVGAAAAEAGGGRIGALLDAPAPPAPSRSVTETLDQLSRCGVVAILRAQNTAAAIARGLELVTLGCRAIEVTLDSHNWREVLEALSKRLPRSVLLGIGTVMDSTVHEVPRLAALGVRFALSPIHPTGFIETCHAHDVLAVPTALTSNEWWDVYRHGGRIVKLFPASMLPSPAVLRSMLSIGPLAAGLRVMPSGGIAPDAADAWWDAGAACVGLGSNLVGRELDHPSGSEAFEAACADWRSTGRARAEALFARAAARSARDH